MTYWQPSKKEKVPNPDSEKRNIKKHHEDTGHISQLHFFKGIYISQESPYILLYAENGDVYVWPYVIHLF